MIPKVTVIVPVYNAGPYLSKCLDSLVNQTLKEIEIVVVLDCPTDGSDRVVKEYARRFANIKVVSNQENLHVGLTRNRGLDVATGEYIAFSDHDDYCKPEMFEKMYLKAREAEADVVVSDFYRPSEKELVIDSFPSEGTDKEFQEKSFQYLVGGIDYGRKEKSVAANGLIWNQIYKRDFLETYHIRFQDNRKITFEDRLFLIEVYYFARKIVRIPEAFYYHVYLPDSEGKSYGFHAEERIINYLVYIEKFLRQYEVLDQMYLYFSDNALRSLYTGFRNELSHQSLKHVWKIIVDIRRNPVLQKALRNFCKKENRYCLKKYPYTKIAFLLLCTFNCR